MDSSSWLRAFTSKHENLAVLLAGVACGLTAAALTARLFASSQSAACPEVIDHEFGRYDACSLSLYCTDSLHVLHDSLVGQFEHSPGSALSHDDVKALFAALKMRASDSTCEYWVRSLAFIAA